MGAVAPSGEALTTIRKFLEAVYGHGDGWVHVTTTKRQIAAAKTAQVADLVPHIEGVTDVYLSAAVIGAERGSGSQGRIEDKDAHQLTALWVDLDRADEPGHKTKANLWSRDDMRKLWDWLPIQPSAVIDSGGGWWLYYILTEPVPLNHDGTGELLLARWGRWWQQIGEQFDRQVDSVFNPGRIARAPGSINGKANQNRPTQIKSLNPHRYSFDQLDELLPAPELPRPTTQISDDNERPGDHYNRRATVDDMVKLLQAHGFHSPTRKGQRIDLTRPGKQRRDGHSVTVWPDASVTFWSSAPEALPGAIQLRDPQGASGTYDPFGVYAALEHGGDWKAAAAALRPAETHQNGHYEPPPGGTLADLIHRELEPIRFVIKDMIPEGLTILAGKPKLGKSWLALAMSLAVCSGQNVLDHITTAGEVLYIALEDGERRIQHRVKILGGAELGTSLRRFHYRTEWRPLNQGGMEQLETWIAENPDTRFIVIDTYGRIRGALPGKDKYTEEYELLGKLQTFATRHRVAVLLVHHLRKQAADDWLEQLSGSQAVTGAADTLLGLFRERGQMDATLRVVSREIEERDIALKMDNGRWESMGDAAAYRVTVERLEILDALEELGGEGRVSDIAALIEKSTANTSKLLVKLEREGQVRKVRYGHYALKTPVEVVEVGELDDLTNLSAHDSTSTTRDPSVEPPVELFTPSDQGLQPLQPLQPSARDTRTRARECPDCGFDDGRHAYICQLKPDPM